MKEAALIAFVVAVLAAIMLTGCAPAVTRWCPAPILVSPADKLTPETARQILTLDREIKAVCQE